jgi:SAM-dependent methyltransferase
VKGQAWRIRNTMVRVMDLSNELRQFGWRDWSGVFEAMPPVQGLTVLDLGCGVGDLAAEMVARGARIIGIDMNEELLREAQARRLPNAEFRMSDLRTLVDLEVIVDGIWCSFTAAYLPDLTAALAAWGRHLRPGGWIALTETDNFSGHQSLSPRVVSPFEAYARQELAAGRYDFHMGRKLQGYLEKAGYTISKVMTFEDQELPFNRPAGPDEVTAWRAWLDRWTDFRESAGPHYVQVREGFLYRLTRPENRVKVTVYCCIATR